MIEPISLWQSDEQVCARFRSHPPMVHFESPEFRVILAAMPEDLTPGLHEALVTEELRARIDRARAEGWLVESTVIDDAAVADILARHVHDRVRDRIAGIPLSTPDRRGTQVDLANRLLHALAADPAAPNSDAMVDADAQLMLEVGTAAGRASRVARHDTPRDPAAREHAARQRTQGPTDRDPGRARDPERRSGRPPLRVRSVRGPPPDPSGARGLPAPRR